MKIGITGDFHGALPEVPPCDLLLIHGDIGDSIDWLQRRLIPWLAAIEVPVIGIAGNHDFIAQKHPQLFAELPWLYLQDEAAVVTSSRGDNIKVWGTPWSVQFGGWAFMRPDDGLAERWALIPADTEILLVHGPARGYGDLAQGRSSVGSRTLLERIDQLPDLQLVAFGHIHEGYGVSITERCVSCGLRVMFSYCPAPCDTDLRDSNNRVPGPLFVNGSHMNARYQPENPPIVVEHLPGKWSG